MKRENAASFQIYVLAVPPPDLIKQGSISAPFYSDVRFIVPLVVFILGLVISGAIAVVCMKHREYCLIGTNIVLYNSNDVI